MSLRAKFSVLIVLLGLTLAINVALSVWSIRFLERELAGPLRSAQPVLSGLHHIKRLGEQESSELGIGRGETAEDVRHGIEMPDVSIVGARVIEAERGVLEELERMRSLRSLQLRSGVSTSMNLRSRSERIMELANRWVSDDDRDAFAALIADIEARHELIERIEGRIIEDARLATDYGQRLRVVILIIVAVSLFFAIAIGLYTVVLIRRWVLSPVSILRAGARRLGEGDLAHRIQISTGDELGQLGEEFNQMARTIESMQDERVERERLAAMGEMAQRTVHNLRTPLAGIRALAETTRQELGEESDLNELQDRIISTVDRFEGWLQGMLRVSSPLALHYRSYRPGDLLGEVIAAHEGAAGERSVTISLLDSCEDDLACIGDPAQLEHALTALLSNAIDFSPEGGEIKIRSGLEGGYWTVEVEDQGPGIEADLQVAVFRPYFTTRTSGTGIGLAMVKRIVEQHHGSIGLKSPATPDSGAGTVFSCSIPVNARDHA